MPRNFKKYLSSTYFFFVKVKLDTKYNMFTKKNVMLYMWLQNGVAKCQETCTILSGVARRTLYKT